MPTPSGHTCAIRASRVCGTAVYNAKGDKIGEVEDVMLDKMSNDILFAVLGCGGFLGIGEKYHAVPWALLDYSDAKDGYIVPLSDDQLKSAPVHDIGELEKDDGRLAGMVTEYYGRFGAPASTGAVPGRH